MKHLSLPVAGILILFYAGLMVVDHAAGTLYSLLFLVGLAAATVKSPSAGCSFGHFASEYKSLWLAMCAPLAAVLVHQLVMGKFHGRSYDLVSRPALFVFILWSCLQLSWGQLRLARWGMQVGVIAAAIKIHLLTNGGLQRYGTDFIPIITFGLIALLMGFFSVLSLAWEERHGKLRILAALAALAAGLYSAYLSQSRGVWLTLPIFALVSLFMLPRHVPARYKVAGIAALLVTLFAAIQFGPVVKGRIEAARADIQEYNNGSNVDTSLGTRFQLWKGSWVLFKEHPLVGVGMEGYPPALKDLARRKIISEEASGFQHSHNEILFMMARLGSAGLLALLAVYFVPLAWFVRRLRDADRAVRASAVMGTSLVLGVFVLGLVDVVFLWWEVFPFYAIGVALLVAGIDMRKRQAF